MAFQIAGCEGEAKMPVLTVRKKGSVLKNIFLNGPPPETGVPGGSPGEEPRPEEEKILIGRHPDCHIVLDHPSISRFHLEIRVRPSSQKLAVVDLSSVHGTWLSGNKIEPHIPVDLAEGDMVRLGASTRVYELHWVPVSSAFDWDKPLPALPEEQEQIHQAENGDIPAIDHFSFESCACHIPSAPPLPQSFEFPLLSPAPAAGESQKPGISAPEEMAVSSIIPALEILSSSSPLEGQEISVPEAAASPRSPEAPLSEERRAPSSLLSRRSKSISFLRVHTGRSRKKQLGTQGFDADKEEEDAVVFGQKRKEETLCKVLFSTTLDEECVDEETLLSDKKRVTPGVSLSTDAAPSEKTDGFFSDRDNCTPRVSQAIGEACEGEESTIKSGRRGQEEEEIYVSVKENITADVSHRHQLQEDQMCFLRRSSNMDAVFGENGDGFSSEKENCTPQVSQEIKQVCKGEDSGKKYGRRGEEEIYISDKENMTPDVPHRHALQKDHMSFLQRSANIYAVLGEDGDGFSSDKENCTPQVSQVTKQACKGADSGIKSGRQGKEEIYASDKENMIPDVSHRHALQKDQMGFLQGSSNIDAVLGERESGSKENCTPQFSQANGKACRGEQSSIKSGRQVEEDEIYVSDKENMTPKVSYNPAGQKNRIGSQRSFNSGANLDEKEEGFFSDKENCTPHVYKATEGSIKFGKQGEDDYVSVKENNITPVLGDHTSKDASLTRRGIEGEIIKRRVDRIPFQSLFEISRGNNSPLAGRMPFQSLDEKSASKSAASVAKLSSSNSYLGKKSTLVGRIPFQSLDEKSASKNSASPADISTANSHLIAHPQKSVPKSTNISMKQPAEQVHHRVEVTKKWYMVADTSCFLDEETRKSMQLLEGLRGTHLIIPRMVIRELDCLRRQERYFRKASKASLALQWIEECMVKTSWWIHVQNSIESMPLAPTPPASPRIQDNSEHHRPVSDSLIFSTCRSLAEILSPTAEDHILDCALLFKKIKSDGQLVLLTNEVSLKIKAMAEGLLCESPQEFRQSLVNPFSQRFLWADSSPRGPTWSCSGQVSENGCFNHCPLLKKTMKPAEGAKGLKLILLHNSHYAQANLINDRQIAY